MYSWIQGRYHCSHTHTILLIQLCTSLVAHITCLHSCYLRIHQSWALITASAGDDGARPHACSFSLPAFISGVWRVCPVHTCTRNLYLLRTPLSTISTVRRRQAAGAIKPALIDSTVRESYSTQNQQHHSRTVTPPADERRRRQ